MFRNPPADKSFSDTRFRHHANRTLPASDGVPMGSILDQNAVHDLDLRLNFGGVIDPKAKYQATLFGDANVGDSKLATKIQTLDVTGQDLLNANKQISFDQVSHKLGNKSAWYAQAAAVSIRFHHAGAALLMADFHNIAGD